MTIGQRGKVNGKVNGNGDEEQKKKTETEKDKMMFKTLILALLSVKRYEEVSHDRLIRDVRDEDNSRAKNIVDRCLVDGVIEKRVVFCANKDRIYYSLPGLVRNILVQYIRRNTLCCANDIFKDLESILFDTVEIQSCRFSKDHPEDVFHRFGPFCMPCWMAITTNN